MLSLLIMFNTIMLLCMTGSIKDDDWQAALAAVSLMTLIITLVCIFYGI